MAKQKKQNDEKKDKYERKMQPPKLNLSAETTRGIMVVVFIAAALVVVLALAGIAGSLGEQILRFLTLGFGVMAYIVPLILLIVAISLYKQDLKEKDKEHGFYWRTYLGAILLTGSIAGLIHIFILNPSADAFGLAGEGRGGGYLGAAFASSLYH